MEGRLLLANEGYVYTGWDERYVIIKKTENDGDESGSLAVYASDPKKHQRSSAENDDATDKNEAKPLLFLPGTMWTMHDTSVQDDTSFVIVDRQHASSVQAGRSPAFQPLHFKCTHGNEKARWMRAADQVNSLSTINLPAKALIDGGYMTSLASPSSESRPRGRAAVPGLGTSIMPRATAAGSQSVPAPTVDDDAKAGRKEFRVKPNDQYPHQWMTERELHAEMLRPSQTIYDPTTTATTKKDETSKPPSSTTTTATVGSIQVEVLGCIGLPDEAGYVTSTKANARLFLVCGEHAFETDVVPSCRSPMFPAKSRRACAFPIQHAFARLFVGVFSDAGVGATTAAGVLGTAPSHDAFIGRVVVDMASLRTRTTYDVTLPLRSSSIVYYRRALGLVRLRLHLTWHNERDAILSYLQMPSLGVVSIRCGDARAFRNLVLTVNGKDLPGQYSGSAFNATMREFDLYKIHFVSAVDALIRDIIEWRNPRLSWYLLCGWMFCVNFSSVSMVFPYAVGFFILLLLENYRTFAQSDDATFGYKGPTITEIVTAVAKGQGETASGRFIEPLDVPKRPMKKRIDQTNNIEFPFSDCKEYPKLTVKDAVAHQTSSAGSQQEDPSESTGRSTLHPHAMRQGVLTKMYDSDSEKEDDKSNRVTSESVSEQDEDVQVVGLGMKEQLRDFEKLCQNSSVDLFNEQLFCAHSDAPPVPKDQRTWVDLDYEFLRGLGIHRTASNPIAVMKQDYMGPMQLMFQGAMKITRASFNVLVWKDPILTFYLLASLVILMLVLIIFPWRPFLAFLGAYVLGPQNWCYRKMETSLPGCMFHYFCASAMYSPIEKEEPNKKDKKHQLSSVTVSEEQKPPFRSSQGGEAVVKLDPNYHKVVIPYTAFNYRRFYDWPPEPTVSHAVGDWDTQRRKTATENPVEVTLTSKEDIADGLTRRKVTFDQ